MKIIDTDRTVAINIMITIMIVMVTKITMDMEIAGRMADTKINERSTTKTFTNYNINNAYGGRVNSHQGLQTHHSREKRNQGANNRQGPQINSSGQNVGFLGCQRNPIDWPPLTEEKLLKTLQELIRAELSNWGPTRW